MKRRLLLNISSSTKRTLLVKYAISMPSTEFFVKIRNALYYFVAPALKRQLRKLITNVPFAALAHSSMPKALINPLLTKCS